MLTDFFARNLDIIFFANGLAFFVMGIAIFVQPRKASDFDLAGILWLLAVFAFTRGTNEFLDMRAIIKGRELVPDICRLAILVISCFFLFDFGGRLYGLAKPTCQVYYKRFAGRFAWRILFLSGIIIYISALISNDSWRTGGISAGYFLGFPGGLLSGIGFSLYYKYNRKKLEPLKIKKYFRAASIGFIVYGALEGLIALEGNFFPANWLNAGSFLPAVKTPVQVFRAACAIISTWAVCGILRIFNWERDEKLQREVAERKRIRVISEGLRAIVGISDDLIVCPDVDTVFKMAVEFARGKLGIERCAIFLDEGDYMTGTYGTDRYGNATDEHTQRFPKDESWYKRCRMINSHSRQWFVVEEPYREWSGEEAVEIGIGWVVATPIQSAHRSIGVFVNDAAISNTELVSMKQDILAVFCSMLGSIAERKRIEKEREMLNKELESLAVKDSHTGLYNHRYLMEIIEAEFERAVRYSHPISILMLDIDYFKSINDVYGHQFGDLVLKQLAQQLMKIVRRYDIVIRFGGEEFIIVSPGIDNQRAIVLAQRILEIVGLYDFGDEEHLVKLKLTIAISSYPEDKVVKGIDLIGAADQVLNKAKEDGGNRVYSSIDMKKQGNLDREDGAATVEVKSLKEKIEKLTKRANQSLMEAVFAFAKTIEFKDHHTAKHTEMTVHYAVEIAKALGLPREDVECVRQACILHDLGKIGTSEQILIKKIKLTEEEFAEIKKHPQIGADIIRPLHFLHNIIPLILYHHERWDGKGYPNGLKGKDIPLGARIVAIADVFEALTSDRPYRKAYSKEEAVKMIKEASGAQFDPKIVEMFLKVLKDGK